MKVSKGKRSSLKKLALASALLIGGVVLSGCFKGDDKTNTSSDNIADKKEITIGVTIGDNGTMIREVVGPILEKNGYQYRLIEFSDYVRPNLALAEGELDINIFQHKPYLDAFKAQHNLAIEEAFQIPTAPYGLYAGRTKSIDNVPNGIKVSAPNDPSNLSRVLVILDHLGWIKLKENINPLKASVNDIADNIKDVEIITLDAAQLPRTLGDVDFSAINGNYAISAGLNPKDAIFKEPNFTFVNWSAVKSADKGSEWLQVLTDAFNSDEFKAYTDQKFEGYQLPEVWAESK